MGLQNRVEGETLGCLGRLQAIPWFGRDDAASGDALDRAGDGKRRDHGSGVAERLCNPVDQVGRDEGPGGIMDQDVGGRIVAGECPETVEHRLLPVDATFHRLAEAVILRSRLGVRSLVTHADDGQR